MSIWRIDGRDMEIMTTGRMRHEVKSRTYLGWFDHRSSPSELRIRCPAVAGQTTWKRPEIARGLEADLCYLLHGRRSSTQSDGKSLARKSNQIADYPNPDMAIEIDLSHPPRSTDREFTRR